jgi:hypothetical protein
VAIVTVVAREVLGALRQLLARWKAGRDRDSGPGDAGRISITTVLVGAPAAAAAPVALESAGQTWSVTIAVLVAVTAVVVAARRAWLAHTTAPRIAELRKLLVAAKLWEPCGGAEWSTARSPRPPTSSGSSWWHGLGPSHGGSPDRRSATR